MGAFRVFYFRFAVSRRERSINMSFGSWMVRLLNWRSCPYWKMMTFITLLERFEPFELSLRHWPIHLQRRSFDGQGVKSPNLRSVLWKYCFRFWTVRIEPRPVYAHLSLSTLKQRHSSEALIAWGAVKKPDLSTANPSSSCTTIQTKPLPPMVSHTLPIWLTGFLHSNLWIFGMNFWGRIFFFGKRNYPEQSWA